jgi:hypothetical protein
MWQFAALATMSLISGEASRDAQRASNIVADATAAAKNKIREGRNQEAAAQGNLARYMQQENNKRRMNAAANQEAAMKMTLVRSLDSQAAGSLESQIANAEQAGAYAANAALSGTLGVASDLIDETARLQRARSTFYRERTNGQANYDAMQQIAGVIPQASSGLDVTSYNDGIDYSVDLSNAQPVQGNWLLDIAKAATQYGMAGGFGSTGAATPTTTAGTAGTGFSTPSTGFWSTPSTSTLRF